MTVIEIDYQSRSKKKVCCREIITLMKILYSEYCNLEDYSNISSMAFTKMPTNMKIEFFIKMKIQKYLQRHNASNLKEALGETAFNILITECSKKEIALKHLLENNIILVENKNNYQTFKTLRNFLIEVLTNDKKTLNTFSSSVF